MICTVPTIIDQTIPRDDSAVMMHLNIGLAVFVTLDGSSQPTIYLTFCCFFIFKIVNMKCRCFHETISSPTEALGLHGFVTYSTKDIQKVQERMLTWRLWLGKRWFWKSRPCAFRYRWGRCRTPTVAYKAQTKSLKGWWRRSVLVSRTKVRYNFRRIWMRDINEEGTDAVDLSSAVLLWYRILWSNRNQRLEKSNRWIFQSSQIHLLTLFSMWVLKHLVTPFMRSPLWHMFCELFISAEGYVASIKICSTITRKTGCFRLLPHLTYHPLSQCTERKI